MIRQSMRLYATLQSAKGLRCIASRFGFLNTNHTPAGSFLLVSSKQKCVHHNLEWNSRLYRIPIRSLSEQSNEEDLGRLLYEGKDSKRLQWMLGVFYSISFGISVTSLYVMTEVYGSLFANIVMGTNVFLFAFVNPYGLYQFGKRYVSKLYHNHKLDIYTVELLSPFVLQSKRIKYSPKECKMPSGPTIFTSFYVNKHPLFVNSDEMKYNDYMEMLRYASDYDFENPERQKQYDDTVTGAIKKKQQTTSKDEKS